MSNNKSHSGQDGGRVLLALLPFWDPQIPPLGIACLKSFLERHSFEVRGVDANLDTRFRNIHDNYFNRLEQFVPPEKRGNLYNIGNQVLRNHLMAYLNRGDEARYPELVKILVARTFYVEPAPAEIDSLNLEVERLFAQLEDYLVRLLDSEKPAVLGLSVYGDTYAASLFAFKLARQRFPGIKTVMGGGIFADQLAPGSPDLDFFVQQSKDYIDKIIIGEGEALMLKFLKGELGETRKIFGIRDTEGEYLDIAAAALPDFSDFDLQHYPHLPHFGARSCPYQCKFCSETVNWGRYRKKNVTRVVEEFIELHRRYSHQLFLMTDSTLNPIITDLAEAVIRSGVSIYWDGFLRADRHVCSMDNTMLWRQGGFYRAKLGLESGSQHVLDLMDKRITVEQCRAALSSLAYAGIKTTTFWLFGFPGETDDDFQKTLDFTEQCKDYIYEADCNAFNYYLTGQVNSDAWKENGRDELLYPPWAREMLISQTRVMEGDPSRETAYRRLNIFVQHCRKLGIPNPYSLSEICRADERWRSLHKNAVPPLVDFQNPDVYIEENKGVKKLIFSRENIDDDDEWL